MGRPKHLLRTGKTTWLEHVAATVRPFVQEVVLLGTNEIPPGLRGLTVIPDVRDKSGPVAAILAAMRSRPDTAWLFLACDLPRITPASVEWLLGQRSAGTLAVMPRSAHGGRVEPLFACYEPAARVLLEDCDAPSDLARHPGVTTPEPPHEIAGAWTNINTPENL
jgi:molybdopterin-guanine dinucleotide biosynthesis protein A